MFNILDDDRVFINYGPIQMSVDCRINNVTDIEICKAVASEVLAEFERLVPYTENLKTMRFYNKQDEGFPWVLNKMIRAVNLSTYEELNTLGAVAGSFSQYAVKIGRELGSTKVIINNGGDIALHNVEDTEIKVGMPVKNGLTLKTTIDKTMDIGGICTSGVSGRSFSKGIATFVTVFAAEASIADACATYIANMTNAEHENIIRCNAEEIDEGTDIKGQKITVKIGNIPENIKLLATLNGYEAAENLYNDEIIKGAVICVDDTVMKIPQDLDIEI